MLTFINFIVFIADTSVMKQSIQILLQTFAMKTITLILTTLRLKLGLKKIVLNIPKMQSSKVKDLRKVMMLFNLNKSVVIKVIQMVLNQKRSPMGVVLKQLLLLTILETLVLKKRRK